MTDTEILRWAAEECLGWHVCDREHEHNACLPSARAVRDLTGWLGFGLAVEAAQARGLGMMANWLERTPPGYQVTFRLRGTVGSARDQDPGIAAWRALYEATGGGK